jgi:uncharacterized glyoxalase superfamily protein PhnB
MPDAIVIPVLGYPDVPVAAKWLCEAFSFRERLRIGAHRVQLDVPGGGSVVVTTARRDRDGQPDDHSVMVRVSDVDAHYARALGAGARLSDPPTTYPYGERQYTAVDLAGHHWTFTESVADVAPAEWGGQLVEAEGDC